MMDHAGYVRVLLSVWVGLGLGQLVQSLHRLARFKGAITWDWLPIVWAGFALLMFLQTWWAYFTVLQSPIWINLFAFILPLAVFVVLYLICASALPDLSKTAEGAEVNLRSFYSGQHRYFFGLWALLLTVALLVQTVTRQRFQLFGEDGFRIAGIAAAVMLAWFEDRRLHVAVTLIALVTLIAYIALFSLRLR